MPFSAVAQDAPPPTAPSPYVSQQNAGYDAVGYAGSYRDEAGSTAAHATLPIPSFAEVTDLDSGRTILVLVNDRGPFGKGRIIGLSTGALKQLGVDPLSRFPVRVRTTNPPQFEKTALNTGGQAAERLNTPAGLLAALRKQLVAEPAISPAKPETAPKATGSYFIQIAAFSSEANAKTAAKSVGGGVTAAGKLWRVRTGPYESAAAARAALGPLRAKGYRDASITR